GACEAPASLGDARLSALHRGDFGPDARFSLTGLASGSVPANSSHPGRSGRRTGRRAPAANGCEPLPRAATPRSIFGIASGDAPHERGCESLSWLLYAFKHKMYKKVALSRIYKDPRK